MKKNKRLFKSFLNERKEHPTLTKKQAWRLVYDHERTKRRK